LISLFAGVIPELSLRSNSGLELDNAFGVFISLGLKLANVFGVFISLGLKLANVFGVFVQEVILV